MTDITATSLSQLGPRICILGPSNSGKSTLAAAIGRSRDLPPVHLDQLYHQPGTDWQPRPRAEFVALHDQAIQGERWVMDGNYTQCLLQRLARATGFILLDASTPLSMWRYVRRCWFDTDRKGALEGAKDSVKWSMLRYIAVVTPANRRRYDALFGEVALPKVRLATPPALAHFYRKEGLRSR
ncbi:AAA family ATPase [Pseudacidovorax sp. RU35E]|uniref:AAA family ATPase n=1 Tax=Pseudacidovorax sp. RU35E TaxID=1907403 RepID=UPI000953EB52|nr:AAA family ATPase [Pseudacidovorax sp. RU35E]SIR26023.1 hypothetical protein SAMN05880557_10948 [Pseudacidovorax sp. RU35E]